MSTNLNNIFSNTSQHASNNNVSKMKQGFLPTLNDQLLNSGQSTHDRLEPERHRSGAEADNHKHCSKQTSPSCKAAIWWTQWTTALRRAIWGFCGNNQALGWVGQSIAVRSAVLARVQSASVPGTARASNAVPTTPFAFEELPRKHKAQRNPT